jgi:ferredoxin-nitrate reductase
MEHKAMNPDGRAIILPSAHLPPHEPPGGEYPYRYINGRTVYHFHTRTKTARAPQLQDAAPDAWVEISPSDAESLGVEEGDMVRVESPRGYMEARARISGIREGIVFAPFHYGYFDTPEEDSPDGHSRAANELTITDWDPVSKQPLFKVGAVRVSKVADAEGAPAPAPTTTASAPASTGSVPETVGGDEAEVKETVGKHQEEEKDLIDRARDTLTGREE